MQAGGQRFESARLHHREFFENCTRLEQVEGVGQDSKGAWWMPRRIGPMKDVVSCDKPRGAANRHRSVDFRMGQPGRSKLLSPYGEHIAIWGELGELKHLSTRRKRKKHRFPK